MCCDVAVIDERLVMKRIDFEISEFVDNNDNVLTMSSIAIVELINMLRDSGDSILRHDNFMTKVVEVIGNFDAPKFLGTQKYGNNNTRNIYNLPKRESMLMLMSYSYDIQAYVYDKLVEYEDKLCNKHNLPTDYISALEQLLETKKSEQLAIEQRDHAIKTKAYISDKKTATALQNSGLKTRIINKLNNEITQLKDENSTLHEYIDETFNYYTILAATINNPGKYSWKVLTDYSKNNGYIIKKVPDVKYNEVNAYHKDVWLACYQLVF